MKRLLHPALFVLAAILVFEEWLWEALKAQLHRLSRLPLVAAFEQALRRLGPWSSLGVLALPALVLLPFKLLAFWALANGHAAMGVGVLVAAKLVGTACAAYLFDIVRGKARQLAWFDTIYRAVTGAIGRTKEWLRAQPAYLAVVSQARALKFALRERFSRESRLARKLKAAKALARRSQD